MARQRANTAGAAKQTFEFQRLLQVVRRWVFIKTIFKEYGHFMKGIQILDPDYEHHNKKLLVFMEDALGRHTNVITSGTYGVVDNAYLLAINVIFAISREADDF